MGGHHGREGRVLMDLASMTEEELEAAEKRIRQELSSRRCPEWLTGGQSCDRSSAPHDEHGYNRWMDHAPQGPREYRITWKALPTSG
jgi:hypothetical protein